jgi:hypothetical protein
MKICVRPTGLHSRAMLRVADALQKHAPSGLSFVREPEDADLQVLHVIGPDALTELRAQRYVCIQYCRTAMHADDGSNQPVGEHAYTSMWENAEATWSYYDLRGQCPRFYFAPLGVDAEFLKDYDEEYRDLGIMSSGFVSGPGAEAIEEVAMAGWMLEMDVVHLGPPEIDGMKVTPPHGWRALFNISDRVLAQYYRRCRWVSGLRHAEGFELPVLEGLMCGARPIVFDRVDMRQWYDGHAVFVPECSGVELVNKLTVVMCEEPFPVTADERATLLRRFSWKPIAQGFWEQVLIHA